MVGATSSPFRVLRPWSEGQVTCSPKAAIPRPPHIPARVGNAYRSSCCSNLSSIVSSSATRGERASADGSSGSAAPEYRRASEMVFRCSAMKPRTAVQSPAPWCRAHRLPVGWSRSCFRSRGGHPAHSRVSHRVPPDRAAGSDPPGAVAVVDGQAVRGRSTERIVRDFGRLLRMQSGGRVHRTMLIRPLRAPSACRSVIASRDRA